MDISHDSDDFLLDCYIRAVDDEEAATFADIDEKGLEWIVG